jgi:L-rhamnose mutarotase
LGKDDKFSYFPFVFEILNALDNNYESLKEHSHQIKIEKFNSSQTINKLLMINPNIQDLIDEQISNYLIHLDEEENEIKNRINLSDIEKDIYLTNLKLMRDYRIQRATNKIFYFNCIEAIVEIIKKNKIKQIETIFNEKFWHILKSIQGRLLHYKLTSTLKIDESNGVLKIKLSINIY